MAINIAEWRTEYASNNHLIDEQHQSLFSLINALNSAMLEGQGKLLLEKTIESLKEYTNVHFETEEDYMLLHHYPNYEAHKSKHEELKTKVLQFQEDLKENSPKLTITLSHFLTNWLIQHIQQEDLSMIRYCKAHPTTERMPKTVEIAVWEPRYETGFDLIDNQHKSLFHVINALNSAMLAGKAKQLLDKTLKVLNDYTQVHFETEEEYMKKYDYPGFLGHKMKHEILREQVKKFYQLEETKDPIQLSIELSHFLTHWLIDHINDEDQKMITFLRQKRLEAKHSLGKSFKTL